jgi:type I site-specific restriction endonuclease
MKRKRFSKAALAKAFMQSNPSAKVSQVAERFNLSHASVYGVRTKLRKEGWNPKQHSLNLEQTGIEMYDQPDKVEETLDARAVDYGLFIEGAEVMQMLKRVVQNALNNRGKTLAHDQAEAMDMIIHKIGRIVNGNPDVVDHWVDIAGYAKLVADRLNGRIR